MPDRVAGTRLALHQKHPPVFHRRGVHRKRAMRIPRFDRHARRERVTSETHVITGCGFEALIHKEMALAAGKGW
jgi:hypothetical protein